MPHINDLQGCIVSEIWYLTDNVCNFAKSVSTGRRQPGWLATSGVDQCQSLFRRKCGHTLEEWNTHFGTTGKSERPIQGLLFHPLRTGLSLAQLSTRFLLGDPQHPLLFGTSVAVETATAPRLQGEHLSASIGIQKEKIHRDKKNIENIQIGQKFILRRFEKVCYQ